LPYEHPKECLSWSSIASGEPNIARRPLKYSSVVASPAIIFLSKSLFLYASLNCPAVMRPFERAAAAS
jgi:hypothetical protein